MPRRGYGPLPSTLQVNYRDNMGRSYKYITLLRNGRLHQDKQHALTDDLHTNDTYRGTRSEGKKIHKAQRYVDSRGGQQELKEAGVIFVAI
jgi:hypothetical protein